MTMFVGAYGDRPLRDRDREAERIAGPRGPLQRFLPQGHAALDQSLPGFESVIATCRRMESVVSECEESIVPRAVADGLVFHESFFDQLQCLFLCKVIAWLIRSTALVHKQHPKLRTSRSAPFGRGERKD
jgi:hypothetical protein